MIPAVRREDFWGDLANTLLLRPVHRRPARKPTLAPQPTQGDAMTIPESAVEAAVAAVAKNYGSSGTPTNTVLWNRMVADVRTCLEAAAPHMNRAINSHEELDSLTRMSVVLSETIAYQNYGDGDWAADGRFYHTSQITLPAKVLHEGDNK